MTTTIAILFTIIIIELLIKIQSLNKKIKYVDEANMWHMLAITDDLTGLYNRNAYNLYIDRNKHAIKKEFKWIILFDVDDFKKINDTKGHLTGDAVLKDVSQVLLKVFSGNQYRNYRIGGDEFAVLAKNVSEEEIINHLITLKNCLDNKGDIRLSKGYAFIKDNPEESFKYADEMLYADKLSKKLQNSQHGVLKI